MGRRRRQQQIPILVETIEVSPERLALVDSPEIADDVDAAPLLGDVLQTLLHQCAAGGFERRQQLRGTGKPERLEDIEGILDAGIDLFDDRTKRGKGFACFGDDPLISGSTCA